MLKNNNQQAVTRLYKRILKQNKLRNVITVIAIVLTTFMFTAIFTMGYSLVGNISQMLLRGQGGKDVMFLECPSSEQIEQARECASVEAAGLKIRVARAENPTDENKAYGLWYYDEVQFQQNLQPAIGTVYGEYPEAENEIMLPKRILSELGMNEPAVGDVITLPIDGEETTFLLSGYYIGFSKKNPGLVSKAYADCLGAYPETAGTLACSAKDGNVESALTELNDKVTLNPGQEWENKYDVQSEDSSSKIAMLVAMFALSSLIVMSGYLLIYNVMYMSVAKDIRFYGLLKTIGTSAEQIKKLVKMQAIWLATIGIPIGMALGTIASFVIVPFSMKIVGNERSEIMEERIHFQPGIYLFALLFSIITIWISSNKPASIAGKVTPVDALRYNEAQGRAARSYKTKSGNKVASMAFRNVFRDKKRCRLVFFSLFLGCMVFLCVNTFIHSLDADSYLESYFQNDIVLYLADPSIPEEYRDDDPNEAPTDVNLLINELSSLEGIRYFRVNRSAYAKLPFDQQAYRPFLMEAADDTSCSLPYMIDFFQKNENTDQAYNSTVFALDRQTVELYNKTAKLPIDLDAFERGEVCMIGHLHSVDLAAEMLANMQGKKIRIENADTGMQKEIAIGSVMTTEDDKCLPIGYGWKMMGCPGVIIVSDAFMDSLYPDAGVGSIVADTDKKRERDIALEVQDIVKNTNCVAGSDIRVLEGEDFKKSMFSLTLVGDGISFILILIGLINFINVMVTGVYTRSKELAILESIGMTKKQLKHMLICEGVIYGGGTDLLILTVGTAMIYGMGQLSKQIADYAVARYPLGAVVGLSIAILVICFVVPVRIFREITKQTVSERIRMGAE